MTVVPQAVCEPDADEHFLGPFAPRAPSNALIGERQSDVLYYAGSREQIEALKDEADSLVAQRGKLNAREILSLPAFERVRAAVELIEAAEQVHESRFA